ncbi:MAG TPA: hypothetical protein VLA25_01200 [Methylotenera sp.]|nr:hypothetical protein [Methylotenera sp.]
MSETIAPKTTNVAPTPVKSATAKPATAKPVAKPRQSKAAAKPAVAKPIATSTANKVVAKPAMPVKPAAAKPKAVPTKKSAKKLPSPKKAKAEKNKPEKIKMERDSFTMPKDEYAQLTLLKARLSSMGQPVKKSELLRAGIKLLAAMSDNTLKTTLAKIPVIKTGRPKKKS